MSVFNFKKGDFLPALIWMILGLIVIIVSYQLDIGKFNRPGPGMMSFLLGIVLIFLSIPILISSLAKTIHKNRKESNIWAGINFLRLGLVLLGLVAYGLLLERVGFTATVLLCVFFLFKLVGSLKIYKALIYSSLTAIFSYLIFVIALNVQFPSFPWHLFF
jgi:hypothetical protein